MSDIIHLLPDSVANQIAAGEVIQRPASVIKELVENAIDADATQIHVLVTDAGKTEIQVIDDGKGMSETDARLCFERHATSKIKAATDLFALRTMGFRGEALASIAAVAQVELRTRRAEDELGTKLVMAASQVESQEPVSCSKGSNFVVRNLFYNIPARRKFLKSDSTEMSNILAEFERIALVHPQVAFTLHSNDSEVLNLPIAASQRQRILAVFGKRINQQLLDVEVETTLVRIAGYVGKPESARKRGAHQFFFVNGRYMRHAYFHKAVMEAFERLVPVGEQVSYFIYLEVDPSQIDVNIHPTKTEIKFENEQAIWQILFAAVKEALGRFSAVPSIDFDTEDRPDIPAFEQTLPTDLPQVHYDENFNPFNTSSAGGGEYRRSATAWETFYEGLEGEKKRVTSGVSSDVFASDSAFDSHVYGQEHTDVFDAQFGSPLPSSSDAGMFASSQSAMDKGYRYLQFKGRFVLASVKSGLMMVDQHRAHVRILYDRYMRQISSDRAASQGLLFAETLELSPSEAVVLDDLMDDLQAVGFDLAHLGGGVYSINGVPAGIEGLNPVELLQNMVHAADEKGSHVREELRAALALSLARATAIVYGQVLTQEEMERLIDELFATELPTYTPDGKVVLATLKEDDIERMFR